MASARSLRRWFFSQFFPLIPFLFVAMVEGQALVPALMVFGDSAMDVGNNNHILTLVKSNFPPYGRDFPGHRPTGRFCNGKLAVDLTAETLGFEEYPAAYLGPEARGRKLLIGANFASASSGFLDSTALLYQTISLKRQLAYYKEYQWKVRRITRNRTVSDAIFSEGIHLLSAGSSDFIQNYYVNPVYNLFHTPSQFSDYLVNSFVSFVKELHSLGARRIGAVSLPPLGCLPASITLYGPSGSSDCVQRLNEDALTFNRKLSLAARVLRKRLPRLKLVIFDIYKPIMDLIKNPSANGFYEARRGCCGTGTVETSLLCNSKSPGTCRNATSYVFWDSFHPTEATNRVLSDSLLEQGIDLIS
ncbi:GDSL esterase/lipase At3g53100-like [Wolffia australiana]